MKKNSIKNVGGSSKRRGNKIRTKAPARSTRAPSGGWVTKNASKSYVTK